jgi:beta-N-acetylhexosaminidase
MKPTVQRRRTALLAALVVVAGLGLGIGLAVGGGSSRRSLAGPAGLPTRTVIPRPARPAHPARPPAPARPHPRPTQANLARQLGQMIVARLAGPIPSSSLLARIQAGQVGGVILFGDNVTGGLPAIRTLTVELQDAAARGGNPPLLIMTDQEGGEVNRLPAPPTLAPSQMTSSQMAFQQGVATGRVLRSVGVNVDLAPVADVERAPGSFLGTRAFGSSPGAVATRACAFARGLASRHVAYVLKHFPGLGRATGNTDLGPVTIDASANELRGDYQAYRTCGADPLGLVMVSNAIYPRLSGPLPAVMSPEVFARELRIAVAGATPLTISDDLQAGALTDQAAPAAHAVNAGLDLLLYAQTEPASAEAYSLLLQEARRGMIRSARITAAERRIAGLKRVLGG